VGLATARSLSAALGSLAVSKARSAFTKVTRSYEFGVPLVQALADSAVADPAGSAGVSDD
jgi:hypothetical protein